MTRARDLADSADKDIAGTLTLDAVNASGVITGLTVEATGDTAAGDNAAMGYTAAEGLILTGQGSTNDVTIKNDADADVIEIPTGTVNVTMAGTLGVVGEIAAASLDISGDIDVDGTTNLDVTNIVGDLTVTGDTITFTSANANDPALKLINTTNDTDGAELQIRKDKGAAGADGDIVGLISFIGDDAAQQQHVFAKMAASIVTAADGSEGGKLAFGVASHDAEFQNGLVLQDGNAEDEIDVTIGNGTSSNTTIAGTLTIPSQLIHAGDTDTLFEFQDANSMRFKAGGNEVVEMTGNTVTFNDGSADYDFRVESNDNTHMLYVDGGNNCVNIGNSTDETGSLNITGGKGTGSGIPTGQLTVVDDTSIAAGVGGAIQFKGQFTSGAVTAAGSIEAYKRNSTDGDYGFGLQFKSRTHGATNVERLYMDEANTTFNDVSANVDFRVESDGNANMLFVDASADVICVGTSDTNVGDNTGSASGINFVGGQIIAAGYQKAPLILNRMNNDGTIVDLRQNASSEGTISVSGSTVSYNGFAGRHESSGIVTSTARGTVVSTIDELDTYPTDSIKAGQTRADHAKVKVSDSVGDARVYGVVDDFDENDKLFVVSVGIASVKVTGSCSGGDLLESNGDGTAKVQSDDIVRSKTLGKVTIGNSNTGVKLVSCVMYCG